MKIDNSVKNAGSAVSGIPTRQRPDAASTPESGAAPSTQVQISSRSNIDSVLANAPVANPDKVAEIKQAIAEGRFRVNSEKIADGLLSSVRQLLDKSGSKA